MTETVSGYNEEEVALTDNKQTVAAYSSENESGQVYEAHVADLPLKYQ